MERNIFVIGLDDFNRGELKSLKNTDSYDFHELLSFDEVKGKAGDYLVKEALSKAQQRLDNFDVPIEATADYWDFPDADPSDCSYTHKSCQPPLRNGL
jgi:hypothetical protein